MIEGTWSVRRADGTTLSQFDATDLLFKPSEGHPRGGEVPFRAIDWPNVVEMTFESDAVRNTFDIHPPGDGYHLELRCRTYVVQSRINSPLTYLDEDPGGDWIATVDALGRKCWYQSFQSNLQARAFLVCTVRDDVVVDPDRVATMNEATVHVTYWLPDGTVHDCPLFECPDVAAWLQALCKQTPVGLMPATHAEPLAAGAVLAPNS